MPLRVRGVYKASETRLLVRNFGLELIELVFSFELYNTNAPETVIIDLVERWIYPREIFDGLTPPQIFELVVNTGYVPDIELPPGVPPGSEPPPNPPPMRERKELFTDFLRNARRILLEIEPGDV